MGTVCFASTLTLHTKGRGWVAGNFFVFDPAKRYGGCVKHLGPLKGPKNGSIRNRNREFVIKALLEVPFTGTGRGRSGGGYGRS